MYDDIFGKEDANISLEKFASLHLRSAISEARLRRDGFLVSTIKKLIKDKDYDQIDQCMKLVTVMREELSFMKKYGLNDELAMNSSKINDAKLLQL